jgi:poly-gamma-glutamate synthesis protein (capsule biosynthesis protein)
MRQPASNSAGRENHLTLFLSGDVMPGRGIDQILPHPSSPQLYESYVKHAGEYVALAEKRNGFLSAPVDFDYIWGAALDILPDISPDLRIINLETAVTTCDDYWKGKGIHYRMHPRNTPCLTAAGIDCCVLANNHVLDWGYDGLSETLTSLHNAGIRTAGAGRTIKEALTPAIFDLAEKGRVLVFSFGLNSSGIPAQWAAMEYRPGVARLKNLSESTILEIKRLVQTFRRQGDIVVASLHWGGNWGYAIAGDQRRFAHRLIDMAAVDIVHGHSSHHPKGIEVYRDKPIMYGCGDLLNDYEGIRGYEAFRSDLSLLYFPTMDFGAGRLVSFELAPTRIRHFRLNHPSEADIRWIAESMEREGRQFGTRVEFTDGDNLRLFW